MIADLDVLRSDLVTYVANGGVLNASDLLDDFEAAAREEGRAEVRAGVAALHSPEHLSSSHGLVDGLSPDGLGACKHDRHVWPCPTVDALTDPTAALAEHDEQLGERVAQEINAERIPNARNIGPDAEHLNDGLDLAALVTRRVTGGGS